MTDFEWTVVSSDAGGIAWGVRCDACKETTVVQGADRLSREKQESLLKDAAAKHECAQDSRP